MTRIDSGIHGAADSRTNSVAATVRRALRLTFRSAVAAALVAGTIHAQESAAIGTDGAIEEVMVTGTRIVRDGYQAPTPVSVLGEEALNAMAVTNIADAVNRLPALSPTVTSKNSASADMTGGIQNLNLRGLSPVRTLVLLDGKRVVGSTLAGFDNNGGAVDVNALPNGLVERVEVVTGGASAVYGSDALAGIVNFILDKDFTGIKGEAIGGITTHGDNGNHKVSVTAGTPFADHRGHLLFSGETSYTEGILHNDRSWADTSYSILRNPDYAPGNGEPQYITASNTGLAVATPGGLILSCPSAPDTTCPLRGIQFLEGGTPASFEFGPIVSGLLMSGGDWRTSRIDNVGMPDLNIRRTNAFTRGSYDVNNDVTLFAELLWSKTRSRAFAGVPQFHLGNVTVRSGNPFIPDTVQEQMTALGISEFTLGTTSADMPFFGHDNTRITRLYSVGAEGNLEFKTNWTWDAYAQRSTTDVGATTPGVEITANFNRAVDTVVDPASGRYVCAVNADADPGNDDPACVPYNVMGIGVNSPEAIRYATGQGWTNIVLTQDVIAANVSGDPWSTSAGPISLAFGAEHRRESVDTFSSELDQARAFFAGNFTESSGEYRVTEGFVETVVPLLADRPLAESLDLNGAVRLTNYSTSGDVVTWKLGAVWAPVEDLTFRATRSRDIRAPNLGELFNSGRSGTGSVIDPENNNDPATIVTRVQGNPNLQPEEADTTGIGIVYRPSWLSGFAAAIDYYEIEISDAIVSLSNQEYVDRCFAGDTAICQFIERDSTGIITFVAVQPANVLVQSTRGIDFDVSYTFSLADIGLNWDGTVALRGMATYVDSLKTIDDDTIIEGAGVNADSGALGLDRGLFVPDWRYLTSVTYSNMPFSATLSARGVSSGVYNNAFIECTSGCPTATEEHPTIDNNHVDAVTYFDLSLSYDVMEGAGQVFFVTENLFDEPPPRIAGTTDNGFYAGQGNADYYDRIGRIFRAGLRFQF